LGWIRRLLGGGAIVSASRVAPKTETETEHERWKSQGAWERQIEQQTRISFSPTQFFLRDVLLREVREEAMALKSLCQESIAMVGSPTRYFHPYGNEDASRNY
jgi:hypothetical protein